MPKTMKLAVISVVKTGRRMQSSDKFMSRPCLCLARGNPRPVDDLNVTLGDDQFAAFKNGLRVHNPRDLDGLDLGNSVLHHNTNDPDWLTCIAVVGTAIASSSRNVNCTVTSVPGHNSSSMFGIVAPIGTVRPISMTNVPRS